MREVTAGLLFPEGPVALADGSVALVEIARRTATIVAAEGSKRVLAEPGGGQNGLALGLYGAIYVINNGGFEFHRDADGVRPIVPASEYSGCRLERVGAETGAVEVLYRETGSGHGLRGPNDLVVDRQGGIYYAAANGIGLSPDESVLYVAETEGVGSGRSTSRRRCGSGSSRGPARMAAVWSIRPATATSASTASRSGRRRYLRGDADQ